LCGVYWYPLYAFIRRQGYIPEEAQDLTQGFFARLLEKKYIGDYQPERGRFRSFLLTSLKHFLANERDWANAQKRGAGNTPVPLEDIQAGEQRYSLEPHHDLTPEAIYDCSGLMYSGVPMKKPSCVTIVFSVSRCPIAFAIPKSMIFTAALLSCMAINTFDGLRSL